MDTTVLYNSIEQTFDDARALISGKDWSQLKLQNACTFEWKEETPLNSYKVTL